MKVDDIHVPWSYPLNGCQFTVDLTSPDPTYELQVISKAISKSGLALLEYCVGPDSDFGGGGQLSIDLREEDAFLILSVGPYDPLPRLGSVL